MKKIAILAATVFAMASLAASAAFAQGITQPQAQSKQQSAAHKQPKVWTDDNIDSVRTPADVYKDQETKEAQAVAEAKQQAAAEAKIPSPPPGFAKPTSVQQAGQLLAKAQSELKSQQDYIAQTQKQLATAPASYQARLQWRIKSRTDIVNRLKSDIAALQKDRADLAKSSTAPAAGSTSAPATGHAE